MVSLYGSGMDSRTRMLRTLFSGTLMYLCGLPSLGWHSTEHTMSGTGNLYYLMVARWNGLEGQIGACERYVAYE